MRDVSEYLAEIGLRPPAQPLQQRVAYQDACHLLHGQKIKSQPRELLKAMGATIVDLDHPDQCCGSAGTYNVTQTELSMQILDRKMEDLNAVECDMVVTGNVGCQLQLRYGMKRAGRAVPVLHIAEVLNRCY
jgi:glycolate oxidase iron-sulfur subunit